MRKLYKLSDGFFETLIFLSNNGSTTIRLLLILFLFPTLVFGYGSPGYVPDGAHPKLFLTYNVLSQLANKVATNEASWVALKAKADIYVTDTVMPYSDATIGSEPNNTIFYSYQGAGWLDAAEVLGLAYKVTGNTAYADKLVELSDVMATATYPATLAISKDSYYPTRNIPIAAALIFDWLYDYAPYTAAKKAALISTVNGWYDAFQANGYQRTGPGYANYFGGHLLGFGLWGMATYGDNTRSAEINTAMRSLWNSQVATAFSSGFFLGGYPIQSFNYGPNHFIRLLEYANGVLTASGENIYPANTNHIAQSLLYNLMPARWQSTDEGTMPSAGRGVMPSTLGYVLGGILSNSDTMGDQAAYFATHLATPPATSNAPFLFEWALYGNNRTQTDYRTVQPLYYRSPGDEHLYYRSDWTDNAVWSSFAGTGAIDGDHQSKGAGHIALTRGADYLLVNAGQWKGVAGYTGTPSSDDKSSSVLNTLFFDDAGAYMYTGAAYKGGQGLWGAPAILKSEQTTPYVYEKTNLTPAYSNGLGASGLNYFHRNYVNLGGTTIVLYDRIQAKSASYAKELRFHLNNQAVATNSGGVIQGTVGNSRVFIVPMSPIGTLTLDTSDVVTTMPRVRILPPPSVTDWNPLTVIATGSNTATPPSSELLLSVEGNMIGAYIRDITNSNVVMFSTTQNDVVGNVTYTLSTPAAGKSPWHTIVNLPPSTDYTVIRPINATVAQTYQLLLGCFPLQGAVYKTSSQGVLRLAPNISIQTPVDGATIAGKKKVSVSIPDTFVVTALEILVDGNPTSATFIAPNSVELNTILLSEGAHTIAVIASDADGNTSQSSSISVTVVRDTAAPTVNITDPVAGQTVSGNKTVGISVIEAFDVVNVNFYVDSVLQAVIGAPPYNVLWDTTLYPNGNHILSADATDSSGNTGTAPPVNVTVSNESIPPVVSAFTLPATATSLAVTVTLLTATDNVAVTGYLLTETATKPLPSDAGWSFPAPQTYQFGSSGSKILYAWAKDASGNVSASVSATVTITSPLTNPTMSDALKALQGVMNINSLTASERFLYDVAPLGTNGKPLGNGVIDAADVILILRRSIGIGSW